MDINIILLGDENTIGRGNRREQLTQCLSCCEQVKRIDVSKRSRKTVDRDGEGGSGDGASITSETLLPGEAPMSTLLAGHHVLVSPCDLILRRSGSYAHVDGCGRHHFAALARCRRA